MRGQIFRLASSWLISLNELSDCVDLFWVLNAHHGVLVTNESFFGAAAAIKTVAT